MEKILKPLVPLALATSLLFSCGKKSTDSIEPPPDTGLSEQTIVLDATKDISSYNSETGIIVFEDSQDFSKGDILASSIIPEAPFGFLREVDSLSQNKDTIYTSQTDVPAAVDSCDVEIHSQFSSPYLMKALGYERNLSINMTFYENENRRVQLSGNLYADLDYDLKLRIRNHNLEYFLFQLNAAQNSNLTLSADTHINFLDLQRNIFSQNFEPFVVWLPTVPPFPLVLHLQAEANAGVYGNLEADISVTTSQSANLRGGVEYSNGELKSIKDLSNNFNFENPISTYGTVDIRGFAGAQLGLFAYGFAGAYVSLNGGVEFNMDIERNPWWQLYGIFFSRAGAELDLFGHDLADYHVTLFDLKESLAQSPEVQGPIASLIATPDSGTAPLEVLLDASGSTSDFPITLYGFYFNDGTIPYAETPEHHSDGVFDGRATHTFENSGIYTAKALVVNESGNRDSAFCNIYVNSPESQWVELVNDDGGFELITYVSTHQGSFENNELGHYSVFTPPSYPFHLHQVQLKFYERNSSNADFYFNVWDESGNILYSESIPSNQVPTLNWWTTNLSDEDIIIDSGSFRAGFCESYLPPNPPQNHGWKIFGDRDDSGNSFFFFHDHHYVKSEELAIRSSGYIYENKNQ